MPHCNYKTTNDRTGYQQASIGSTDLAKKLYGKNMGLTLLRAVTNDNSAVAKDKVVLSVGPIAQQHGLRQEDPSDPGTYRRNPINKNKAVTTSVLLSGIGLFSTFMAIQSVRDSEIPQSLVYGAIGAGSLAMLPDYEVRF